MSARSAVRVALAVPAIVTGEKSFRKNPAIGSAWLNARGLHRRRVALAAELSARRRRALAPRLDPDEKARFDRDGFVIRQDALPADLLARLRAELAQTPLEAWGMRQGHTVNRVIPLPTGRQGSALSDVAGFFNGPKVRHLAGYAAGRSGHVITALQTICVDPQSGDADPQANLHADTFHPTAKVWLFLNDVGEHDGPFAYVPGSHKLTAERLAWEHEQALSWRERRDDPHHAAGSFRLPEARLGDLGYGPLRTFPVRENTLVVADTFGFHRRCPSRRPTIRTSLYGVLRRNPFVPWNGGDPLDLPFLNGNAMRLHLAMQDRRARAGKSVVYHAEGPLLADAAPTL